MASVILAVSAPTNEPGELTFTNFSKLPPELRRMCWRCALPGPRIITVMRCISQLVKNDRADCGSGHQPLATSNALAPAMLFVNFESREVALGSYELTFRHHLLNPIYFDFGHDTFFFPSLSRDLESFLVLDDGDVGSEDHARIERLIVGVPRVTSHKYSVSYLKRFKGLASLVLTADYLDPRRSKDSRAALALRISQFKRAWQVNKNRLDFTIADVDTFRTMGWPLTEVHRLAAMGIRGKQYRRLFSLDEANLRLGFEWF